MNDVLFSLAHNAGDREQSYYPSHIPRRDPQIGGGSGLPGKKAEALLFKTLGQLGEAMNLDSPYKGGLELGFGVVLTEAARVETQGQKGKH